MVVAKITGYRLDHESWAPLEPDFDMKFDGGFWVVTNVASAIASSE